MKIIYTLIISTIILISLTNALTARIGNSLILVPAEVESGKTTIIEKTISIENTNPTSVNVTLRASSEIQDVVQVIDNDFIMQSTESKDARFKVKLDSAGEYVGTIFIKISSVNSAPIELPVKIVISAKSNETGEPEQKNTNNTKTNLKITEFYSKLKSKEAVTSLLLLSNTLLSCVLLLIIYRGKLSKDKKKREQGTLRKIDKDKLKK